MDEMIQSKPGDIKAFYRAYNKAVDYMNETDPAEYSDILSNYQFPEQMSGYLSSIEQDFQHAAPIDQYQSIASSNGIRKKVEIKNSYSMKI